ncbi:MAG: protein kinase family protein [Cytophagia bacterium]|nr:protein kinase family protein [Cytophagia bacterium]
MKEYKKGDPIKFIRSKDYKFIKNIGQGGTGKTVLLQDEIINEQFICKKYSPFYIDTPSSFFEYFKEEIKLLHLAYHKNIVRVYNYYLYPENHTGFILMEYIEGEKIDHFIESNPERLNNIFEQAISGFEYLESSKILHRDIRPENIIISKTGELKIIDFGFGKKAVLENESFNKSLSLNWRYARPNEFNQDVYDFKTEIYFLGKLFEEIIKDNHLVNFGYKKVLDSMCNPDYEERIDSFFNVRRQLSTSKTSKADFNTKEKEAYREFAHLLINMLGRIDLDSKYKTDIDKIISNLSSIHQNSILEEFIFNTSLIPTCFIEGNFSFYPNESFHVSTLEDFIKLLTTSTMDKRKIIMNNLWQRFDSIRQDPPSDYDNIDDDSLPF